MTRRKSNCRRMSVLSIVLLTLMLTACVQGSALQKNRPKEAVSDNSFCSIYEFDEHCGSKVCLKNDFRYLCLCDRGRAAAEDLTCPAVIHN